MQGRGGPATVPPLAEAIDGAPGREVGRQRPPHAPVVDHIPDGLCYRAAVVRFRAAARCGGGPAAAARAVLIPRHWCRKGSGADGGSPGVRTRRQARQGRLAPGLLVVLAGLVTAVATRSPAHPPDGTPAQTRHHEPPRAANVQVQGQASRHTCPMSAPSPAVGGSAGRAHIWVTSMGGPLLAVPVSALSSWGGCTTSGMIIGGTETPDDYDRACAVQGLAGVIAVGDEGAQALVLADEPATSSICPNTRPSCGGWPPVPRPSWPLRPAASWLTPPPPGRITAPGPQTARQCSWTPPLPEATWASTTRRRAARAGTRTVARWHLEDKSCPHLG